jgi:perosamine synthetase
MSSMQAALGDSQLKRLKNIIEKKREKAHVYLKFLKELEESKQVFLPLSEDNRSNNSYWIFGIVNRNASLNVKKIQSELMSRGIETRPFFWPLHLQPALKGIKHNKNGLTNSEYLGKNGFYVPLYLDLENEKIEFICNQIKDLYN